ncbi:MAG: Prenyltransferase, UbiA family [Candidatus Woesebacteria bacterium GW2011_GWB1_38_5b]|uniref:Prenyltransferase, UbiA family n=1 Tax=Candidatus Woesebacteria bacterium GW2011_GWB1_38_5b TaxID=1618569 RepID=A0A0G0K4V4_9BACT|nr:MAG: Prenyltransferase, UbiA family [Candidatus Woesebacteria bacterium GW2011_GWB1_38_5b]
MKKTYSIIRLLRPRQWIKNFAIFASVVFTGELFNPLAVNPVIIGFLHFVQPHPQAI